MKQPTPAHRWYVYIYMDTRPEKAGEVIYVGKGTHDGGRKLWRMDSHWDASKLSNLLFRRVLSKIREQGREPARMVMAWFDEEVDAYVAESLAIAGYGLRRDGGTLCNLTYGGEGTDGYKHVKKTKKKIGAVAKELWQQNAYVEKRSAALRKYFETQPERVAANHAAIKAAWTDEKKKAHGQKVKERGPEFRKKLSESFTPETRAAASKRAKELFKDPALIARRATTMRITAQTPEFRAKMSEIASKARKSPEGRASTSASQKALWADPAHRAKMMKARSKQTTEDTRAKLSAKMKVAIANFSPELKAKLSKERSERMRAWHAEQRAKESGMFHTASGTVQ